MQLSFFEHIERGRNVFDGFLCHDVASKGIDLILESTDYPQSAALLSVSPLFFSEAIMNFTMNQVRATKNVVKIRIDQIPSLLAGEQIDLVLSKPDSFGILPAFTGRYG
jgi:hypothetical protein